jgi:hypothetical protein
VTAPIPAPYSRWRLRESADRLAVSYDAAAQAIDTFTRAAQGYDPHSAPDGAMHRLRSAVSRVAGHRGWTRVLWFAATLLLTGSFLAWVSLAIVRRFIPGPVPLVLAVVPGVLATLTLAGTAGLVRAPFRAGPRSWPFAIALAGCAAWLATWLIGVAGLATWYATAAAMLSAAVAGAAFLAASRPAASSSRHIPIRDRPAKPRRRLLARQRAAQKRLHRHADRWSHAAHACGLAVGESPPVEVALNRLLTGGTLGELPVKDVSAFHMQILTTLVRYQPGPLDVRLRTASDRLVRSPGQSIARSDRSTQ